MCHSSVQTVAKLYLSYKSGLLPLLNNYTEINRNKTRKGEASTKLWDVCVLSYINLEAYRARHEHFTTQAGVISILPAAATHCRVGS